MYLNISKKLRHLQLLCSIDTHLTSLLWNWQIILSRSQRQGARWTMNNNHQETDPSSRLYPHPKTDCKEIRAAASPFITQVFFINTQASAAFFKPCFIILHASESSQVLCFGGFWGFLSVFSPTQNDNRLTSWCLVPKKYGWCLGWFAFPWGTF